MNAINLTDYPPISHSWSDTLRHAIEAGYRVDKYADPTEGAREGLTLAEAIEVASEDPSLLVLVDGEAL